MLGCKYITDECKSLILTGSLKSHNFHDVLRLLSVHLKLLMYSFVRFYSGSGTDTASAGRLPGPIMQ